MLYYDEQLERGIFMKATKKLWDISYFDRYFFAILITSSTKISVSGLGIKTSLFT